MSTTEDVSQEFLDRFLRGIDLVAPEHRKNLPTYINFIKEWFGKNPGGPKEHKGCYLYLGFEPESAEYAYDKLELHSGDVLVATYPKTGTNWVGAIVRHIIGRKDPELLQKHLDVSLFFTLLTPGPASKFKVTENLPFERRVLGTHIPASLLNLRKFREKGAKVIYVTRNPKDQAISWYNFMMAHPQSKSDYWKPFLPKQEKAFYDLYIAGKQNVFARKDEGYLETVRDWYEHKNDENVLFMVYETIKKEPRNEIRKLAEFIGEYPTEEELDWIVEKTLFSSMKKEADSKTEGNGVLKLFNKGEIGYWKNHLTVAQSELIDEKVERILGDTDIKFIYE